MADAKRCDRCGKCFDPYNMDGDMCQFRNPVFQNSERLKEQKRAGFLYEDAGPDTWVDLCPTCSQAFSIFMNGGELEKRDGKTDYEKIIAERDYRDKIKDDLKDLRDGIWEIMSEMINTEDE